MVFAQDGKHIVHQDGNFKIEIDASDQYKLAAAKPKKGDRVSVHYSGKFLNGEEFDSSFKRDKPFIFNIGENRVIQCWDQTFLHLTKGMKATVHCPSEKAYGSNGAGKIIPPNSDLRFDVQLIDINPEEQKEPAKRSTSTSRRRRSSWEDLPKVGDPSTHQCLPPMAFYGAFSMLMSSFGYFLYACMLPVNYMTKNQQKQIKAVAVKKSKKISEGKDE